MAAPGDWHNNNSPGKMMVLSDIKTVEWMLTEWGRWSRSQIGINLGYPSIEPYERLRAKQSTTYSITDDEAQRIDSVVSRLRVLRESQHGALYDYYVRGFTYREIAKRRRTNHKQISDLVGGGRMWVEGAIDSVTPFSAEPLQVG